MFAIRAYRRHQKELRKRDARGKYPHDARPYRYADNMTVCSGPCCGNPRRWFGEPTMQERRKLQETE